MAISTELIERNATASNKETANTPTECVSANNVSTQQIKFQQNSTGEKSILTSSSQTKVADVPRKPQQNRMREKSILTPKEAVVTATKVQNELHKNKSGEKSILSSTSIAHREDRDFEETAEESGTEERGKVE